jgi:2-polyprenyl-3-methyl-5-hydroxy-6-metoxy-1,4-benzoquinol methylase
MDPDKLKHFARNVFGALTGAMTSTMIHLGDKLGLYQALADGRPRTSAELAEETGLQERWLREWLFQQGAAGVLETTDGERFALSEEGRVILVDENHPAFGAGFFTDLPGQLGRVEHLPESFRTGLGFDYDAHGSCGAAQVERGFAPWFRAFLVSTWLPQLPGVVDRLSAGVEVADLGCGAGVALLEMARAFPKSRFHGWDVSAHALARAEQNRSQAGLDNVSFHDVRKEPLPDDARFALVTTFDCLHDMTDPAGVMKGLRRAVADDGTWFASDMKAHETYAENVERNPMAAMMYGISVTSCMSSALSEPGGAGLGTLGLFPARLEAMARDAGFTRFEQLELGHPVNAFYRITP